MKGILRGVFGFPIYEKKEKGEKIKEKTLKNKGIYWKKMTNKNEGEGF